MSDDLIMMTGSNRECGECTLCCKLLDVEPYDSPAGEYCKHCVDGQGCSNYENRDWVCREFECLWKKQPQIPDVFRPDKIGVLFDLPDETLIYMGVCDKTITPNPHGHYGVRKMVQKLNEAGHAVVLEGLMYTPEGEPVEKYYKDLQNCIVKDMVT